MRRRPVAWLTGVMLLLSLASPWAGVRGGGLDAAATARLDRAYSGVPGVRWATPPGRSSRDVTDLGRGPSRTHYTTEEPGYPLCLLWTAPLGKSRSQPLIVRTDYNYDGIQDIRIYHLAGSRLWALDGDMDPPEIDPALPVAEQLRLMRASGFIIWDIPVQEGYSASQLSYWRAENPADDVVYAGTGKPSVMAVSAYTGAVLGEYRLPRSEGYKDCLGNVIRDFSPDYGLVGAPLVYPDGTVVVGTTDGEVFIIRSLATGHPVTSRMCLGGRMSSAPVPIGTSSFVVASDGRASGGGYGYLAAFWLASGRHWDFERRWELFTPAGIPGEVAVDGAMIYFADKRGTLYAAALADGRVMWHRAVDGFINKGPGVSPEEVYFAARSPGGTGTGNLLAVHKRTGEVAWSVVLPGDGNTAPVPVARNPAMGDGGIGPGMILVGDTRGHVTGWRNAAPAHFAIPEACRNLTPERRAGRPLPTVSADLTLTEHPYRAPHWWDSISGAGTQMTVGYDLMLMGVNSTEDRETALHGYRLLPSVNFTVRGRALLPPPYAPGDRVPVELTIIANANRPVTDVPVTMGWAVGGVVSETHTVRLSFRAGASRHIERVEMVLPAAPAEFWAAVNPEALRRDPRGSRLPAGLWPGGSYSDPALAYEVSLDDNIWRHPTEGSRPPGRREPPGGGDGGGGGGGDSPPGGGGDWPIGPLPPGIVRPPGGVDLAVDWLAVPTSANPEEYPAFTIRVSVSNKSAERITTTLRVTATGPPREVGVTLEPRSAREFTFTADIGGMAHGERVATRAVVDPENRIRETDETNNSREAITLIVMPPPTGERHPPDWGSRLSE